MIFLYIYLVLQESRGEFLYVQAQFHLFGAYILYIYWNCNLNCTLGAVYNSSSVEHDISIESCNYLDDTNQITFNFRKKY